MKKRFCIIGMLLLAVASVSAQEVFGWRGPNRDGIYPETGLLKEWPAQGPALKWETTVIGKGYSSPIIVGNRLYITGMDEDQTHEVFYCFDLNGQLQYSTVYSTPWTKSYPETRTTPAIQGDKAWVISGSGDIVCLNIADGSIVWKVEGDAKFQRKTGNWGTSECPLVYDDKIVFMPGGELTTMVALNKNTGEVMWQTESLHEQSNYVNPLMITHNGQRIIVSIAQYTIIGVNPDNGEIMFKNKGEFARSPEDMAKGYEAICTNTPIYKDGYLFFSNGYDMGSVKLKISDDNKEVTRVWRNESLDTHHGHQILLDGVLYGSNWTNNTSGNWMAVDWETGQTLWETAWPGGKGKGSIVSAEGKLYQYDERRGFVALVNPSREKLDIISEFRITKGDGPFWAHPVINDGVMYIRHGGYLAAFSIK